MATAKRPLDLLIAAPRGFCAGVDRAINIVELALERYGAPVYVRHEIVHNRFVVDGLRAKGAVFVKELDEVPDGVPVVFSAHGVPKAVPAKAEERGLSYFDATCPLVSKVHRQADRHIERGRHILFIGHAGHPEVIGTFGQVPEGEMTLVETVEDAESIAPADPERLAFLTQTTLSVDDTAEIVSILKRRFPNIAAPKGEDICYATSNRQSAVKEIAARCDAMLVIGAPNSSNSVRLVEVAKREGVPAMLIGRAPDIDFSWLDGVGTLGLTAGASAPEVLVREVVDCLAEHFDVREQPVDGIQERMVFKLPRGLEAACARNAAMADVEIFTDGACKGNPGPGGWGAVIRSGAHEKELSGGEALTTNNRMELLAAIRALEALKRPCTVRLTTDSVYVRDGITKWIFGWQRNGWKTADRKPVKNAELWQELLAAARPHKVDWRWVKGHAGHAENERADKLACDAALQFMNRSAR